MLGWEVLSDPICNCSLVKQIISPCDTAPHLADFAGYAHFADFARSVECGPVKRKNLNIKGKGRGFHAQIESSARQ